MGNVVLFCDLLGVRELWKDRGSDRVLSLFNGFEDQIHHAFNDLRSKTKLSLASAEIDSDSAAFVFGKTSGAVLAGIALWRRLFELRDRHTSLERVYLRGTIVGTESARMRKTSQRESSLPIRRMNYSKSLLDAISLEKSGFKGMRLLVDRNLLDDHIRSEIRRRFWELHHKGSSWQTMPELTARVGHANYPSEHFHMEDVLWMMDIRSNFQGLQRRWEQRISAAPEKAEQGQIDGTTPLFNHVSTELS